MEKLRFKDAFDYRIVHDDGIDTGDIYIAAAPSTL